MFVVAPIFSGGCSTFCDLKFFIHLAGEERAGCFTFVELYMSCRCDRSLALPRGAMGL